MRALTLALSLAIVLLAAFPADADNYTGRSGRRTAASPAVPDSAPEPAAFEPTPTPVETTALAPPAAAPAPAPSSSAASSISSLGVNVAPVEPLPPPKFELVWLSGKLPEGAQAEGDWIWASDPAAGETLAHSHPSAKGIRSHRFVAAEPMEMPGNGMVVQEVWLDPQDPPQGIALRFTLASGEEVGVYWEGEKEVFTPTQYEELWYYGMLPELGKWVPLEILAEDLGLGDSRIAGITFATCDGRALWGRTVLTEAPPLEGEESEEGEETPQPLVDTPLAP